MVELKRLMFTKRAAFFFISFIFLNITLSSQPTYLQFDNISNGLSTNLVTSIYQDSKGWIWFTSVQGLHKYDGFKVKTYKISKEDSSNFIGSLARCIFEDGKGFLWVGTETGGLYRFDREKEKFAAYFEHDNRNKIIYFSVYSIAEDKNGDLWLGTNMGLKKFDKSTGKFTTYASGTNNLNSLYSNYIVKLHFDRNGKLWMGTTKGLDRFDPVTKSFEHVTLPGTNEVRPFVSEIFEDKQGRIWIGTFSRGLYVFEPNTRQARKLIINKDSEFSNSVRAILQANNGDLWIGTGAGLYIYSPKTNRFSHFTHDQKNPLSLCHNSIISLFQDKQENIWIGTQAGISYMIPEKQAFHFYDAFSNNNEDFNNNGVNAFWADDKNIWIATDYGGINILDKNKQVVRYLSTQKQNPNSLSTNSIRTLVDDGKGNVWICTYGGGMDVYNLKTGNIKKYTHNPADTGSLSNNWVGATYRDRKGNFWIGTLEGIDKYDPKTDQFIHYNKIITNKLVGWISEDSEGNLWFGSYPDIFIYNPKVNRTKKFSINRQTLAFLEDKQKRLWLATTNKGIALLDRKTLTVKKYYNESTGIANNSALSIIEDDQQTLWIGTANGLSRFFPDQEKFRNFYKDDGTRITTYNYGACYKLPSGELLFGGYNGFVTFDPKDIQDNEYLPPVELTDFRIFNQSVPFGTKGSPLTKHISETKDIVLNYNQNFISFRYIALNYNSPHKNGYAYKLEGIDKDWVKAGDRKEAYYTNLEPGEYEFKVIASNNDNQWNKVGTSVNIRIIPPFYKTWWFRISVILWIAFTVIFLIRWRIRNIKNKNVILEHLVNEKTKDLQQLAIELEESQSEVMAQNEEIEQQNETLTELNEKINKQNEALKHYANDLENKVKERTAELEIAKNKAEESDKLKSSILTNMSHEIRTPMNSIVGLSNLLMQEDVSQEDKKFFTINIKRNSDILLHLINDILDLSVIEAGKMPLHFNQVNINELLTDLHEIFNTDRQWLEKSHLDFRLHLSNNSLVAVTDKVRLGQIIRNLLHNAFKFTDKGYIELGYKITVLDIVIYVKDSGIGIPPEKINSIFDRFVKLQDENVKSDFGVGLGLAICSKLIQMLGGKIWVESEPRQGSTFFISVPLREENIGS
jgi:ligand-binding sensor domain-containing protein/signal transduction histidine kinase